MFLLRETSQKNLKAHICEKKCDEIHPILNDFGTRQFDLLLEEIQMIKPKIILVANALASRIFKEKLSSSLSWKEEKGTYMLNLNDLTCPIFFSGMLSGQRAMDVFSRERLSWHMEKVVKDKIW